MKCPKLETLQEYIDCELDIALKKEIENHILSCEKCSKALNNLKENDDFVFSKISSYREFTNDRFVPPIQSSETNKDLTNRVEKKRGVYDIMMKYKRIATAACAAILITTCVTVQPVRSAIASTLSIFRVQKMEAVNITINDLQEIRNKLSSGQPEIDMDKIGKIKVTGGQHKTVQKEILKSVAGFNVAFPSSMEGKSVQIGVTEPASMDLALNVPNINDILKTLGATKLLPSEIDGKNFNVAFASRVSLNYNYDNKNINIIQTMAPEVRVPDGVNVDKIYESLIELPIIPQNLKSQLLSIKDWKTTIPVPVMEGETQEITINGVKAYVNSREATHNNSTSITYTNDGKQKVMQNNGPFASVIWYKDGIIYGVSGNVTRDEIIAVASSMR